MVDPSEQENKIEAMTGRFYFENGAIYEGEWKYAGNEGDEVTDDESCRRVRHGHGKYAEGAYFYEGEWSDDQMHGYGDFHFASGSKYSGDFNTNRYHGLGTFTCDLQGQWEEGKMHGNGSYTDSSGKQWDGQFYNGSGPGLKYRLAEP